MACVESARRAVLPVGEIAAIVMFSWLAVTVKHRLRKDTSTPRSTIEVERMESDCVQCCELCIVQVQNLLRLVVHAAAAAKSRSDCCHEAPRVLQVRIPNSPLPHIPTLEAHHNTTHTRPCWTPCISTCVSEMSTSQALAVDRCRYLAGDGYSFALHPPHNVSPRKDRQCHPPACAITQRRATSSQ